MIIILTAKGIVRNFAPYGREPTVVAVLLFFVWRFHYDES